MAARNTFLKNYGFSMLLLGGILTGSVLGIWLKERAAVLKPLGDIFLNLLFTLVVPLVFFSIASAIAKTTSGARLRRIAGYMLLLFVLTGAVAAFLMVAGVTYYPPAAGISVSLPRGEQVESSPLGQQIVQALTVSDFGELFSRKNMLALILVSAMTGWAAARCGTKASAFIQLLESGNEVMGRLIGYVMLYAPIGLMAYFAYLVGTFGPKLMDSYLRVIKLYYPMALLYFLAGFTFYAFLAGRGEGVRRFWRSILPTAFTAWATGSSVASIPANLSAAKQIGVPEDIREVVIPVGATIHMEGSCLSAILKIAFLFGIFGQEFSGAGTILVAVGVALLSGTVMSGIPGGGFLGEMLIVTLYGFPPETLPLLSMIGTLVDPPATMVNACGDNVCSMLVARILSGPQWMKNG